MNLAEATDNSLSGVRLSAVTATPSVIKRSRWSRVRIECRDEASDLSDTAFIKCSFKDTYLGNAKLRLERVCFEDCEFKQVTFMHGRLHGAVFRRSKLTDCLLRSADLRDSHFEDCVIESTDFAKADFTGAVFDGCELLGMDHWGWQPFEGAQLDDSQRFKHFIAKNLRSHLSSVPIPAERLKTFLDALDESGFGDGEAMYLYSEWMDSISFEDFIVLGKSVTQKRENKP